MPTLADLEYVYLTQAWADADAIQNPDLAVDSANWTYAGLGGTNVPARVDISADSIPFNWAYGLDSSPSPINNSGRLFNPTITGLAPGEPYALKVWVRTTGVWRAYVLDTASGTGPSLREDFLPNNGVWMQRTLLFTASSPNATVRILALGGGANNPVGTVGLMTGVEVASTVPANSRSLSDLQRIVYGPSQHAYFSSLSGLAPAQRFSLNDHKIAYYRAQLGVAETDPRTLSDLEMAFWRVQTGL